MTDPNPRWLVVCSSGWTRESISKLHLKLGRTGIEHVTRVETPDEAVRESELPLI